MRTAIAKSPDDIQKGNWLGFSSDNEANAIETLLDYLGEPLGE
ncbi:hypothetical protein [Vreelandella maris]|nr:hypothetical protein [Halomonas maris]